MSRTVKRFTQYSWLRCQVSKKQRNKKKSKGHTPKNCWICW